MATLLYFGKLGDVSGQLSETLTLPDDVSDTSALRAWLDQRFGSHPALQDETIRIAINSEIVAEPHGVKDTDEIAFMPPVGGG